MDNNRARVVAKVLAQLVVTEAGRAVGGRRRSDQDREGSERARARAVRRALEDLGPFYVKIGQMLSTRPDIVSEVMIEEFRNLHEQVKIAPFTDFEPILAEELGREWRTYFTEIETEQPLGAASLAQVYRVTLAGGRPAVVKIQRPGIRSIMLDDMALLRKLAKQFAKRAPELNALIDVESMLGMLFDAMEPELDFTLEAANMRRGMALAADLEHLTVPEVIFATPRVLVQEMAPGRSIRHVNREDFTREEREAIGKDLLSYMFRGFFLERFFHADPHPGNIFVSPGKPACIIDWGMVGRADRRMSMTMLLIIMALGQNDGTALAKAWIELGTLTPWADISGFISDMQGFVPKIVGASMEELDFGVALTAILKYSTRRGIQTGPVMSLLGKAFANVEGSVRYIAPELTIVDTLKDELKDIMMSLAKETLSEESAAKVVVETMMTVSSTPEQVRGLMRDLSNREFTLQNSPVRGTFARREARSDRRAATVRRTLVAVGAAAAYWDLRRRV